MTDEPFITATDADQRDPVRMRELRAESERTGKMLIHSPRPSFHGQQITDSLAQRAAAIEAGTVHTIKRDDSRSIFRNLDAIARGDIFVVD